ncbi:Crp/Fnr family transcriptional regulator [Actinosynnema mirum]|uniref:Crp/Fnr family transcriptional regulator n=1 Tax=Actinosynnema mirum TaxID=40567 RepID=UPI000319FC45|nr:Crp/Fnr family transcriptional regulator [Actinosynnema mirum]
MRREYRKGEYLLRQGFQGTWVLALVAGRVKVVQSEGEKKEALIALRGAGDLVGEIAAPRNGRRIASVQAVDPCTAVVLEWTQLRACLGKAADGLLLEYLGTKLAQAGPYKLRLMHFKPERKIARLVLELAALSDPSVANPDRVPFTQQEIADSLGIQTSTVAEHVKRLRAKGALVERGHLVLGDREALHRAAGV